MKADEPLEPEGAAPKVHRIDALMMRYSRWRRKRLVSMVEVPLTTLTLRTLYLSGCILLDGVCLPWIATMPDGGFSYPFFAALLLPSLVIEALVYRRMTTPQGTRA